MTGRIVVSRLLLLASLLLFVTGLSLLNQSKLELQKPLEVDQEPQGSFNDTKHPPYSRYGVLGQPLLLNPDENVHLLYNIGYVVAYSDNLRVPKWCSYRIAETVFSEDYKRYSNWHRDKRVKNCPDPRDYDYRVSKVHRGHLAPSFAMYRSYGTIAMIESFYMTNAVPMSSSLNTGIWAELENKIFADKNSWANVEKEVWVICGPIFDSTPEIIGNKIFQPKEYFKIILRDTNNNHLDDDSFEVLAFRFPEAGAKKEQNLYDFFCSIDSIEKDTSLDFFPELEDKKEMELEAVVPKLIWE